VASFPKISPALKKRAAQIQLLLMDVDGLKQYNDVYGHLEGDEMLKDKVNSLLNQGRKKIVLNLAEVPYIDSAGLGEVVRTFTTVSRQGGNLKLLNLTKRITDLLAITKLLTVFDTYDSEQDAVQSFSASAKA